MHIKVAGKLFAAVIDRQNIDMSLVLREAFPGLTLDSGAIFSAGEVPARSMQPMAFIAVSMTNISVFQNVKQQLHYAKLLPKHLSRHLTISSSQLC